MEASEGDFLPEAQALYQILSQKGEEKWIEAAGISPALAQETSKLYQKPFSPAFCAALGYKGSTFQGLSPDIWTLKIWKKANKTLRIFSALYGLLKPLDLIQKYRLDFSSKSKALGLPPLMSYWKKILLPHLGKITAGKKIINCASSEFNPLIQGLEGVITPRFLEWQKGSYKQISTFSKKARGTFASWLLSQEEDVPLESFNLEGYKFNSKDFPKEHWVFTRKQN